jgi:dephospho-CoA kinase
MIIIGLTGSIGMGKTTVASQLAALGAAVCSADDIVHRLLGAGGAAVAAVGELFPQALKDGAIDRKLLGDIVFHDDEKMQALENILHPLVVAEENRFIEEQRRKGAKFAVLEIPLLYETGAQSRCDAVIVVSAPYFIQKRRVMKRPGMSEAKFQKILSRQLPDRQKRTRADFIVQTGLGLAYSGWQVKRILRRLDAA